MRMVTNSCCDVTRPDAFHCPSAGAHALMLREPLSAHAMGASSTAPVRAHATADDHHASLTIVRLRLCSQCLLQLSLLGIVSFARSW